MWLHQAPCFTPCVGLRGCRTSSSSFSGAPCRSNQIPSAPVPYLSIAPRAQLAHESSMSGATDMTDTSIPVSANADAENTLQNDPDFMAAFDAAVERDWKALQLFGESGQILENDVEDDASEVGVSMEQQDERHVLARENVESVRNVHIAEEKRDASDEVQSYEGETSAPKEIDFAEQGDAAAHEAKLAEELREAMQSGGTRRKKGKRKNASSRSVSATAAERKRKAKEEADAAMAAEQRALEEASAALWDGKSKWYFLQTKPGCEQSCAISLRNLGMNHPSVQIKDVLVPAMKIMRLTKSGKSVKKEERIYPGYILINMVLDYASYGQVQSVPNVQFFMGDPNRDKKKDQPFMPPMPVSDSELHNVLARMKVAESMPEKKTIFRPGDHIEVCAGPFEGQFGTVMEVKPDIDVILAKITVFGRDSSVELKITDVARVAPPEDAAQTGTTVIDALQIETAESEVLASDGLDSLLSPNVEEIPKELETEPKRKRGRPRKRAEDVQQQAVENSRKNYLGEKDENAMAMEGMDEIDFFQISDDGGFVSSEEDGEHGAIEPGENEDQLLQDGLVENDDESSSFFNLERGSV